MNNLFAPKYTFFSCVIWILRLSKSFWVENHNDHGEIRHHNIHVINVVYANVDFRFDTIDDV